MLDEHVLESIININHAYELIKCCAERGICENLNASLEQNENDKLQGQNIRKTLYRFV